MAGSSLSQFCRNATAEAKAQVGSLIVFSTLKAMAAGVLKYDFHPGNYLVAGDKLVLLDFGGMDDLGQQEETNFFHFIKSVANNDMEAFEAYLMAGNWVIDPDKFDFQGSMDLHRNLYLKPFVENSFHFDDNFAATVYRYQTRLDPNLPFYQLPPDRISIMRLYWTLYSLLGDLKPQGDFRNMLFEADEASRDEVDRVWNKGA